MKFGMNLLLWTGELNEDIKPVLHSLKGMGYDGVEFSCVSWATRGASNRWSDSPLC